MRPCHPHSRNAGRRVIFEPSPRRSPPGPDPQNPFYGRQACRLLIALPQSSIARLTLCCEGVLEQREPIALGGGYSAADLDQHIYAVGVPLVDHALEPHTRSSVHLRRSWGCCLPFCLVMSAQSFGTSCWSAPRHTLREGWPGQRFPCNCERMLRTKEAMDPRSTRGTEI